MEDMELVKKVAAAIETRNTDTISLAQRIIVMVRNIDGADAESNVADPYTPEQRKYASVQDDQNTGIVKEPDVAYRNEPETKVDKRRKKSDTK